MSAVTVIAEIDSRPARAGAAAFNAALASMRAGASGAAGVLGGVDRGVSALSRSLFSLKGAFASVGAGVALKGIVSAADEFEGLRARIGLFAPEGVRAESILSALSAAAERSRAPVGELSQLYVQFSAALQQNGKSAEEQVRFTETLFKLLQQSGPVTEAARQALFQFSQSMASGVFRGQEFNSVAEQAPGILRALSAETGKTAGELRKMAEEGQLTADVAFQALINASADVDEAFKDLPKTAGAAATQLTSTFGMITGEISAQAGVSSAWAEAIDAVREVVSSPDFKSAFRELADFVADAGRGFADLVRWINDARFEIRAWTQVLTESAGYKELAGYLNSIGNGFAYVWNMAKGALGSLGSSSTIAAEVDKAKQLANELRTISGLKGSQFDDTAPTLEVAAPTTKKAITFAAKTDEAEAKRVERTRQQLAERVRTEQLRLEIQKAELAGNEQAATFLQDILAVEGRITDEQRERAPEIASQLESQILIGRELERQAERQAKFKDEAREYTGILTEGLFNAVMAGESLTKSLRNAAAEMVKLVAQKAILNPIADSISGSIGSLFGSLGGSPGSFGASMFGLPFADGGILQGPTRFTGGGVRGTAGEAGPEAILPLTRMSGGKLGVAAAGGASAAPIINNFYVDGDMTDATVAKVQRITEQVFASNAPGLIAQSVSAVQRKARDNRNFFAR